MQRPIQQEAEPELLHREVSGKKAVALGEVQVYRSNCQKSAQGKCRHHCSEELNAVMALALKEELHASWEYCTKESGGGRKPRYRYPARTTQGALDNLHGCG